MKRLALAWFLLGSALMLILIGVSLKTSAGYTGSKTEVPMPAGFDQRVTVHAEGRGAPAINLADGRETLTEYTGDPESERLLQQDQVQPLAMASSDFDEDGVKDLVAGYAASGSGLLTLRRGNVDSIYPNTPDAQGRKAAGAFTDAPFLSPARVFNAPRPVSYIGSGDFDSDGHADVVTADRGGRALYFFHGDGRGNLAAAREIGLAGRITTMAVGETSRGASQSVIAVAVTGSDGQRLLMFQPSRGMASPSTIALPAQANAVAIGRFTNDFEAEAAVAAGHTLMFIRVRSAGAPNRSSITSKRPIPFTIRSIATGDFTGGHHTDIALLTGKGDVRVLSRSSGPDLRFEENSSFISSSRFTGRFPGRFPGAAALVTTRLSTLALDTVVAVDPAAHKLHVLAGHSDNSSRAGVPAVYAALEAEAEPVAALPMRLNSDAISDLVVLTNGRSEPTAILSAPPMTFVVTNTNDTGAGSLRAAIDQANMVPGADNITFITGLGTINVGALTGLPLPKITEAVTIDGGATKVELDGSAASGAASGIDILASNVTIRNLVINRFSGSGISLEMDTSIIEGNFVGTNAAGSAALPNLGPGVSITGSDNAIGGMTPAARNVISGNAGFGVEFNTAQAFNNTLKGNFIGTDASGTNAVGNAQGGVRTLGSAMLNVIGGIGTGAGNTIANNIGSGVNIFGGLSNAVLGNSIFSNGGSGIDLSDDAGSTPNDPCDPDGGANNLQNFPVLTSATNNGATTTIIGSLDSDPGFAFRIEFFSSSGCDGSGFGEGKTFIGSTDITTSAACNGPINVVLPVGVAVGQVITATATSEANDTSEFSDCVTVVGGGCTLTCPPDRVAFTSPTAASCATAVTFTAAISGDCGPVICAPPSGAVFAVGTTTVSCSAVDAASCSFTVLVVDITPPSVTCTTGFTTTLPPRQSSGVANYPTAAATDNCAVASVVCAPPPGSTFPAGSTLVTCTARDVYDNASNCFFFVTMLDGDVPVIVCPANVSASLPAGQTSAVVTYPPPTATDNFPGVRVVCIPASGSTFPAGATTVVCTATDATENKSSCVFTVSVGGPQAKITIPGNKTSVEFAASPTRKAPKPKNNPCSSFTIQNVGFGPLVLTLDSIARTGSDVDSGKITDPNDTRYFSLSQVNSDQSLTALDIGATLTVQPGQVLNLCAKFAALIPALAGKTTGLAASNVLPDAVSSKIVFRQNAGANLTVPLLARVSTGLVLVNPANPKTPPEVTFTRSADDITVSYAVFDSNLDVTRAKYEFLDGSGQVVAGPFEIDLTASISSANLVRGQSFSVTQRFTGANSNPDAVGVRLTVFDGETSVGSASTSSATRINPESIQLMNRARRVTLYPPDQRLSP